MANHALLIARNGTERPIDDSAAPIRDEVGEVTGVVLVFRDVTPQRRAEEALRLSDEQSRILLQFHQAVMANMGEGLYAVDTDGLVTYMNPAAERLFGWTRDELLGRRLHDLTHFKHPDGTPFPIEECAGFQILHQGKVLKDHDDVFIRKDGTFFAVVYSSSPLVTEGKIVGLVVVFRDVTERKKAEDALRQSEERYRFLSDVSAALVGSFHYQSILREVAERTVPTMADFCFFDVLTADGQLERVGWNHVDPAQQVLSDKVKRFVPTLDAVGHPVAKALRSGRPEFVPVVTDAWLQQSAMSPEHLEYIRELKCCSAMVVPLLIGQRRLGTLSFYYSVSGRHHTTEDLRLAEELARRAALTVENAKLYSQLRETDRRKDEFLATLSHELRNPLSPIRNALVIMKQPEAGPALHDRVREMMERQVAHMGRLLDDLLDVSRINRGWIELRKEVVDLAALVGRAVEAVRPLLEERRHELSVSLPPEPVRLSGDPTRLEQLLTNLLNNSAKYTDPGGQVWLTVERDRQEIVVRVRDTGIGIAADVLPRIFDLFVQGQHGLDRSQGGVGIGLTLARRLVELHGGRIEARSPGLGRGSEFTVRLPALAEPAGRPGAPLASGDHSAPAPVTSHRVLVVDDNVDAAESLAMFLRLSAQEVRVAYNGPDALAQAATFQPELVILDIGLPGMDGYEVAKRLRAHPVNHDALLVALTGWGQDEDRRRSRAAGFDHHLVKPVDPATLQRFLVQAK
jgi:PAS domain S-box-containing protein